MLRPLAGLLLVAVVASGCRGGGAAEADGDVVDATPTTTARARPTPETPTPTATPPPQATPTPSREPEATDDDPQREARLEELRASNQFLEFAEADRARHATWARFAYDHFARHVAGGDEFEWANRDELWNSIAPRIRDECLLAGSEIVHPMWDAQIVIPVGLNPSWNDDDTGGRGFFIDFSCMYSHDGRAAELWIGALISERDHHGTVLSLSRPTVLDEGDYPDMASAHEQAQQAMWSWVIEQPRRSSDGA